MERQVIASILALLAFYLLSRDKMKK